MLQVEHRVAEVDVAVDLPDYRVDCFAVDLPDCLILIIKGLTEREYHGDPMMLRRKRRDLLGEVKKYLASITSIKESPQKD
ncbi:unnamed protein product, partial [Brassica rapa]